MGLCKLSSAYFKYTVCLYNEVHGISEDGFVVLWVIKGADLPTVLGPDSSVGIATCYGLEGTGIEYWRGRDFHLPSRRGLGSTQLPIRGYLLFPGIKWSGNGPDHPLPSSAEVKEIIELYIYSSLWTFLSCSRMNLYLSTF
jgi:hypothetical protein